MENLCHILSATTSGPKIGANDLIRQLSYEQSLQCLDPDHLPFFFQTITSLAYSLQLVITVRFSYPQALWPLWAPVLIQKQFWTMCLQVTWGFSKSYRPGAGWECTQECLEILLKIGCPLLHHLPSYMCCFIVPARVPFAAGGRRHGFVPPG